MSKEASILSGCKLLRDHYYRLDPRAEKYRQEFLILLDFLDELGKLEQLSSDIAASDLVAPEPGRPPHRRKTSQLLELSQRIEEMFGITLYGHSNLECAKCILQARIEYLNRLVEVARADVLDVLASLYRPDDSGLAEELNLFPTIFDELKASFACRDYYRRSILTIGIYTPKVLRSTYRQHVKNVRATFCDLTGGDHVRSK